MSKLMPFDDKTLRRIARNLQVQLARAKNEDSKFSEDFFFYSRRNIR